MTEQTLVIVNSLQLLVESEGLGTEDAVCRSKVKTALLGRESQNLRERQVHQPRAEGRWLDQDFVLERPTQFVGDNTTMQAAAAKLTDHR